MTVGGGEKRTTPLPHPRLLFSLSDSAPLNRSDKSKDLKVFPSEKSIEIPQRRILQTASEEGREEEGKKKSGIKLRDQRRTKVYCECW